MSSDDNEDTKTLSVGIEYPTGAQTVKVEVPADTTRQEARNRAKATFNNRCFWGFNASNFPEGDTNEQ